MYGALAAMQAPHAVSAVERHSIVGTQQLAEYSDQLRKHDIARRATRDGRSRSVATVLRAPRTSATYSGGVAR
jgi:hypothetical protein